jgi:hypothetical protein
MLLSAFVLICIIAGGIYNPLNLYVIFYNEETVILIWEHLMCRDGGEILQGTGSTEKVSNAIVHGSVRHTVIHSTVRRILPL